MYKHIILFAILVALTSVATAADVLVESRSGGQNNTGYTEPEGRWLDSNIPATTSKSSAPGLEASSTIGSRKTTIVPNSGEAADKTFSAARFTPPITEAGDYHVYITWPRAANATPLSVFVKHAKGEETKQITQDGWGGTASSNADKWIEVGTFSFSPAGDQYVELRVTGATGAADPRNPIQAFADAIRFSTEPVSSATKPSAVAAGRTPPPETPAPAAAATFTWANSLADARSQASQDGKNVFVYFYSPGSSRSTEYETRVLDDSAVKTAITKSYVPVKINMDTESALAAQLQVFRAGTIGLYDAKAGSAIAQISDTPDASELVKQLNK